MNRLSVILPFLFGAILATAADTKLTGEWQIQRNAGGRESTQTCTFTQTEGDLGGTCSGPSGPVKLTGKINGKKVTWTFQTDSEGGAVTVIYNGAVDSENTMSGSITAVEFSVEGEFKATRSK